MDIRVDICPTFVVWGICHRRHRCNLRHPSHRYLKRPKQKASSPQPVNEEPIPREPNSYVAVLAKNKPQETEKFFVDLRSNLITKNTLEEEWPALGSPEQGLTIKGPDEKSKATADQIENDRLFAENLQDSEYTQFSEYDENDEDNYNPEEQNEETSEENEEDNYNQPEEETYDDNDGDNYNPEEQEEETNEKNEISLDGHHEIELTHTEASLALPKISRMCDICMDRPKDVTLVCGHRYCYQCALQMRLDERVCAICRRCIVSVIKTYN